MSELAAPRRRRVGVVSLGCAKNLVDTEVMLGHLRRAGYEFVTDPAEADVVVVNTCSFIDAAREESVEAILEATALKADGHAQRVVVAGCLVQRYGDELREQIPEVDAFVDLDGLDAIVAGAGGPAAATGHDALPLLVESEPGVERRIAKGTAAAPWSPSSFLYDDRTPRVRATPPWSAYVKIAEGCDHTCAFCAIPSFRGGFRSRAPESLRREAERLGEEGVRELLLIAQDSSHYGRDLGLRDGLASLLRSLDEVEAVRWIRLHYLYPNTITPALIEAMAGARAVLDYVDLPLQHAHPAMLKRMRRGGSGASHARLLASFRAAMPEVTLRSTFIVGFPGETDEEFDALLDFLREIRFDHVGAFTYSHEQGTSAAALDDDVPAALKRERLERLMALQQSIAFENNAARVGRTVEVLAEGPHPDTDHLLVGRMRGQAPDVDGQVLINDGLAGIEGLDGAGVEVRPGAFVRVEITETAGYDLVGRVAGHA